MFFPARAAAGAWVGQGGDRPRDAEHPDQGDAKLHVWCWEVGRGCLRAMADAGSSRDAEQGLLRATELKMKPQGAQQAAEDGGPMARVWLGVELPGHLIGLLAVVGEAVLLAARMDGEAHPMAARPVWWLVARALRV
jgi:hypothetical protein